MTPVEVDVGILVSAGSGIAGGAGAGWLLLRHQVDRLRVELDRHVNDGEAVRDRLARLETKMDVLLSVLSRG